MPQSLYNFLPCSPRSLVQDRGLDLTILSGGYTDFLASHNSYKTEATAAGITLGTFLHNPWGRGPGYRRLPNGAYTSMFLDQIAQAWDAGYTTLTADILANTTASTTILYIGSVPDGTLLNVQGAGAIDLSAKNYSEFVSAGYGFAFDALTTYNGSGILHAYASSLSDAGDNYILAEANRFANGIPLLATHDLWSNPNRVQPEDAPANSMYWWRAATLDGPFSLSTAKAYLEAGLKLAVRLNQLTDSERASLFQMVAEYESPSTPSSLSPLQTEPQRVVRLPKGWFFGFR